MPFESIVGAIIGLVIAWLILVSKSGFRMVSPTVGEFHGPGCIATLLLYLVLGGIGFVVGLAVGQ